MAADLFVSYSRRDRDQVMPWVQRLHAAGVSAWVDERGIDAALHWGEEIAGAIESCKIFLLILSPASAGSEHIVREVSLALDAQKPILPLVLEPAQVPPSLRYPLAGIQHLELFHGDPEENLAAILRSLARLGVEAHSFEDPPAAPAAAPDPSREPSSPPASPSPPPEPSSTLSPPPQEPVPNNLPRLLTSFIGRQREIAEVKQRLTGARLLTLIGSGGSGKTRLALQVAAELLDRYPEGVWLVELEAVSSPSLLSQTVASALGVREEAGRPLVDTLADFLRSRSLLLLLDNCEHLIAACAQLAQALLRACPNLQIVATSQEALGVRGEVIERVPSLSLPNGKLLQSAGTDRVAAAMRCEAVQLFVERASAVQPSFAVTAQNAAVVAQVCRRLDGIPLALELAAARAKVLSVEQIAQRLDDRFRLLTGGSRTALPRQQTLRAAIDWSYELLTEAERGLLRRLAVFLGGWSLPAAESVCAGGEIEEWEVLDLLTQLADKSLVVVDESVGADARYSLLETIREYGHECLQKDGEDEAIHDRHARFFLDLAEAREGEVKDWLDRLEPEHGNLRTALTGFLQRAQTDESFRLATALWRLWYLRGYWTEGREWLAAVLALPAPPSEARAMLLRQAGQLAWLQTDYSAARSLLEQSLALYRELGNTADLPAPLNALGEVARTQGDYPTARAYFQESLELLRARGDRANLAWALQALGEVAQEQGDAAARGLAEESLALFQEVDDRRGISFALSHLGEVARAGGELERARRLHEESLAIRREIGHKGGIARSLGYLGSVAANQDRYEEAGSLYSESLLLRRELGDRRSIAACLELLAGLATVQGQPERAAHLFGAAEALRESLGAPLSPADRVEYERHLDRLRAQLPGDTLASAWADGRAMPLDEAVALALEESSPIALSARD